MTRTYCFPSDTNLQLAAIELRKKRIPFDVDQDVLVIDDEYHENIMELGLGAWEEFGDAAEEELEI